MDALLLGQLILEGVATGSLYAMTALGIVWIFRTYDLMNFAHGEMAMFATFVSYSLMQAGLPYAASFLLTLAVAGAIGAGTERLLLRRIRATSPLGMVIVTLGLFMIFNGAAAGLWGTRPARYPTALAGPPLEVAGLFLTRQNLAVLVLTGLVLAGLFTLLKVTRFGIATRAASERADVARLMGIPVGRYFAAAWGTSVALGAAAGMLIAPTTTLNPNMMITVLVKGFTGAVLGGFSSLPGAVVGGLLLGVMENLVGFYLSTQWKNTLSLLLILIVLILRPQGLLGRSAARRV